MPGQKRVHFTITVLTNDFGVDAVLPADLGDAPHANRKHTKAGATDASFDMARRRGSKGAYLSCRKAGYKLRALIALTLTEPAIFKQELSIVFNGTGTYDFSARRGWRHGHIPFVKYSGAT